MQLIQEREKNQLKHAVEIVRERKRAALKALRQSGFRVPSRETLAKLLHEAHHPHP
ncbi:hypothetical protein HYW17_02885 [Candidatus Uhrbacteria bacterium]|nr:hypothetical protein [Candidatus Uhrbacteria bacterium]